MEVHQESQTQLRELQIGQDLSLMDRRYAFDRFDLNDDLGLDDEVNAIAAA